MKVLLESPGHAKCLEVQLREAPPFFRTYKRTLGKVKLQSRTVALVHREVEGSLLAVQLLLTQGTFALSMLSQKTSRRTPKTRTYAFSWGRGQSNALRLGSRRFAANGRPPVGLRAGLGPPLSNHCRSGVKPFKSERASPQRSASFRSSS